MSEQKGSTLAKKLANVMGEVSRVKKSGRNSFHNYDYATESDLTDAIRVHLAEQGVAILPSVLDVKSELLASSKRSEILTTVELEITLVCADSGEQRVVRWRGQGLDAGDKGYYKAYTGAMKYFLMKTFLISTGDDPEDDGQQDRPRQAQASAARAAAPQDKKVTPVAIWQGLMDEIGISTAEQLKPASTALAASSGKGSVRNLSDAQLTKINEKLAAMSLDARRDYVRDLSANAEGKAA